MITMCDAEVLTGRGHKIIKTGTGKTPLAGFLPAIT